MVIEKQRGMFSVPAVFDSSVEKAVDILEI
jgi:hypothetical protein